MFQRITAGSKEILYRLGLDEQARSEVAFFVRSLIADLERLAERPPSDATYLHFGCGLDRFDGFVNCDRVRTPATDCVVDVRGRLPFRTASVSGIFHQHVFEHVDYPRGARRFLEESARVLRPGGRLRMGVPDLARYVDAYVRRDAEFARRVGLGEIEFAARILNHAFGHGHRFLYDFEALRVELERAGFREVRRAGHRDSADPMLNRDNDRPDRTTDTLFVEARR